MVAGVAFASELPGQPSEFQTCACVKRDLLRCQAAQAQHEAEHQHRMKIRADGECGGPEHPCPHIGPYGALRDNPTALPQAMGVQSFSGRAPQFSTHQEPLSSTLECFRGTLKNHLNTDAQQNPIKPTIHPSPEAQTLHDLGVSWRFPALSSLSCHLSSNVLKLSAKGCLNSTLLSLHFHQFYTNTSNCFRRAKRVCCVLTVGRHNGQSAVLPCSNRHTQKPLPEGVFGPASGQSPLSETQRHQ